MNRDHQTAPLNERAEPTRVIEASAHPSPINPANESPRFSPRPSNGREHSVDLHIDELVLHGFNPAQRYRIGEAAERELTRLLGEQEGLAAITRDIETDYLNGGVELNPDSDAEAIGIELARAVYGGLRQ